jgi:hypothetical protein
METERSACLFCAVKVQLSDSLLRANRVKELIKHAESDCNRSRQSLRELHYGEQERRSRGYHETIGGGRGKSRRNG